MSVQFAPPTPEVPQSHLAGILALALALGLHAAFALQNQSNPVEQAGGNTALAARGSSFANMAAGVETPQQAEVETPVQDQARAQPQQPVETPQVAVVKPTSLAAAKPVEVTEPLAQVQAVSGGVPLVLAAIEPTLEDRAEPPSFLPQTTPEPPVVVKSDVAAATAPAEKPDTLKPVADQALEPSVTQDPAPAEKPVAIQESVAVQIPVAKPLSAVTPDMEAAVKPLESEVQPPEPQSPPVIESLRPPERPKPEVARRTDPKPAPKTVAKPSSKPKGNGDVNATRGVATSTRSQPGGQARTTGGSAKVQGNAAASNYAGLVMRRIHRAKRRADVRGEALVRFSITSGGGVAAVSLARSSGSGKLDGIALAQVRRAAPFPPPPPGARTSFTVRIKGK
jgi:periplasmic protein TonB